MHIVLLGPPGVSVSALSKKIVKAYRLNLMTPNSLLEMAAAKHNELGQIAREARETGRISDDLLFTVLQQQWQPDKKGSLFVDIPQNEHQIDLLESVCREHKQTIDLVINLKVDNDALVERLVGYIHCDHCGADYNLYINPPIVDRVCDHCGRRVKQRPADYEETLSNRLRLYDIRMAPVLACYTEQGKLEHIPDNGEDLKSLWQTTRKHIKHIIDSTDPDTAILQEAINQAAQSTRKSKKR